MAIIAGAKISAEGAVTLHGCEKVDMKTIGTAQDCIGAAGNADTVSKLEEVVLIWCKQIEQVLNKHTLHEL